ncbi:TOBE domain-containing protein [Budviciaceae bacterium CWB-B4]|uniref:TOBE domain-containing protein n=1 Tax=Limnobaculum xujianqingii TaxID=2738837 RepID=A0A9D7AIE4_9GAMM|nr:TOBE domain-containing protein [Limnobaculum xujianqingii]MBK5073190.1 TOBE domain-containing protein [Limnobaculum xujianqingii]MBK5176499.1 TOBE domain-containing protein [Limnobaculum xujianqingii]
MKVSARNQLKGIVESINSGAINDEVTLRLDGGENITAVVTKNSVTTLGLVKGKAAIAIFKAPWVILASTENGLTFSARNQFKGSVESLEKGSVNSIVNMVTESGLKLSAVVTNNSVEDMQLQIGSSAIALIKASNVILATEK